ncbi:MAG: rod shape-determining protein MreD [Bacteroidota bacterium]|nr:rod shape-determining protein MreD [Candidatus Kapabacteria bacterium]MDW8220523.1 rod shape-determining protein MreD [Bacteroidota bacterium]
MILAIYQTQLQAIVVDFFRTRTPFADHDAIMNNPVLRYIAYAITALLLVVASAVLVPFIAIEDIVPDLVLLWAIWVALQEGQMIGMIAGFGSGLLLDVVLFDVLGSNALAKVIAAFIAGYFYLETREQEMIGSMRFPLIVALCALTHNFVYYFFYLRPTEIDFVRFFLRYGLWSAIYTVVLSLIPMLVTSRRYD